MIFALFPYCIQFGVYMAHRTVAKGKQEAL